MRLNEKNFSLPKLEEKILKFWKENQIFDKAVAPRGARGKAKKFVFFEGPPTANGRPGIHHILARAFKDIILRYKTMRGYHVPRKSGWDTHGLPVEIEVEKALGLKSKKEIEAYGIAEFNKKCKESVWKYKDEWERLTERMGFWLDLKDSYITYETSYIETLWWIIKQIWNKKLLYKGHKIVPWCTRCGTALSSHELALGYKEVEDAAVFVKFKIKPNQTVRNWKSGDKTYVLAWTTTPWTLPGNVALAVGSDIEYVFTEKDGDELILAKDASEKLKLGSVGKNFKGGDLVGLEYKPLFDIPALKNKNSHKIYAANFVNTTEGTGVVHTAVMYGEDDYNLGKKIGLPQHHTVDEQGKFTSDVPELAGMYVKSKEAEKKILDRLTSRRLLFASHLHAHEYPFCWRCGTALIYYARDSWFVAMSKLRNKLLAANKKINWIPENLKTGRFGGWLKEAKDWAFSRERYWGTPLPMWQCEKCNAQKVIGSREELSNAIGKPRNRYILMRHGESENNRLDLVNNSPKELDKYPLTLNGRAQSEKSARKLKKEKIDFIFSSDFRRTKETAEIVRAIATPGTKILLDERLREIDTGIYDGGPPQKYRKFFGSVIEKFTKTPENGESLLDVCKRASDFISDMENRYEGETILVVAHDHTIWAFETVMRGWSEEESARANGSENDFIKNAEWRKAPLLNLPRNEHGVTDLHRPLIDGVVFNCDRCSDGKMRRAKEVVDVWFDSGAMPFAQSHWLGQSQKLPYPADYIVEGIDQTRGWFYTLLAVAVALGKGAPYKNVIANGILLDKHGKKMSKSRGNAVDPWTMIEKYGVDVARWYFYTSTVPGEPKILDEADLQKTSRQFFEILRNSYVFYQTYAKKNIKPKTNNLSFDPEFRTEGQLKNTLDKWIIARLNEVIASITKKLDEYEIGGAAREIEGFVVEDLSRWYIRRSRERLQRPDQSTLGQRNFQEASEVLGRVLLGVSKLIAPFTPFFAEALYKSLVNGGELSVHLMEWPSADSKLVDKKLLKEMEKAREFASIALAKNAEIGRKIRQPLQAATTSYAKYFTAETIEILKEELNVKEIYKSSEDIVFDTKITPELREEGVVREFVRIVQGLRGDAGLQPKDAVVLMVECADNLRGVLEKNESVLKNKANVRIVEYRRSEKFDVELATKFEDKPLWIALRKSK